LIADCYQFGTGETMSQRLRFEAIQTAVPKANAGKLSAPDLDVLVNGYVLGQAIERFKAGQARGAVQLIDQLPYSLKTQKFVSLMRVKAAQALGERQFTEAVEQHRALFGSDPGLEMLLITRCWQHDQWADAVDLINSLRGSVGEDPFLIGKLAEAYWKANQKSLALRHAQLAVAQDPSLVAPHRVLLSLAMEKNIHTEISRLQTVLRNLGDTLPAPTVIASAQPTTTQPAQGADQWTEVVRKRRDEQLAIYMRRVQEIEEELRGLSKAKPARTAGAITQRRKELVQNLTYAKKVAKAFEQLTPAEVADLFKQVDDRNDQRIRALTKVYGDAKSVGEAIVKQQEDVLQCTYKGSSNSHIAMLRGSSSEAEVRATYTVQYRAQSGVVLAGQAEVELYKVAEGCWVPRMLVIEGQPRSFTLDSNATPYLVGYDGTRFLPVPQP
jgi:hypothetical protein